MIADSVYMQIREALELSLVMEAEMVFTTLSSTGRKVFSKLQSGHFETVLIDEAAQASEVTTLQALTFGCQRYLLRHYRYFLASTYGVVPTLQAKASSAITVTSSSFESDCRLQFYKIGVKSMMEVLYNLEVDLMVFHRLKIRVPSCCRVVLVGDPQQLPATILSQKGKDLMLDRSLFERLEKAGCPVHTLQVQYRMHPFIREFPSRYFYENALKDG